MTTHLRVTQRSFLIVWGMLLVGAFVIHMDLHKDDPQPRPVDESSPEQKAAAAKMIRLAGYDCRKVDVIFPYMPWNGEGFTVRCNDLRYKYEIENHGGRWSVKAE